LVTTVLVKFSFTNPDHVPTGIPRGKKVTWEKQKLKEAAAAVLAYSVDPNLGKLGRFSPGRGDTGVQTENNLQLVQLGIIRRGLTNVGYQLRSVHVFYVAPKPDRRDPRRMTMGKHVVELEFVKGGFYEEATATEGERAAHKLLNSPEVVEAIRALANTTWQWCHVWDNGRVSNTATVNVGGRLPEGKPIHGIAVRQGRIVSVKLQQSITESEE
jgi:hypothetical protein